MSSGVVLGVDTATAATVVGLLQPTGESYEARDDPKSGGRPGHATRLLGLIESVMDRAGTTWEEVSRIGVGVGPGSFTGVRIGVTAARALGQAREIPLVPVSSLAALAGGFQSSRGDGAVAAVIDARRGEVFAGLWRSGSVDRSVFAPSAVSPGALAERLVDTGFVAVGDGAVRYREELEAVGLEIPTTDSTLHRISGVEICRLALTAEPVAREAVLPDYFREPDAVPSRQGAFGA